MTPALYRNKGAPWRRPDGTLIERGAEFVPTVDELARRAYKLVHVGPAPDTYEPPQSPAGNPSLNVDDYATGHGWYLIGGKNVQGREAAAEALRALREDG